MKKPKTKFDNLRNKQIDILVAEKIKGWKYCLQAGEDYDTEYYRTQQNIRYYDWCPTFNFSAAVEASRGHKIRLSSEKDMCGWFASVDGASAYDATPARALCKALLLTLEKKNARSRSAKTH